MTYAPAKFEVVRPTASEEMHLQENTLFDLDIGIKVTRNFAQYSLHHVTYTHAQFESYTTNSLGEYAFTSKYII